MRMTNTHTHTLPLSHDILIDSDLSVYIFFSTFMPNVIKQSVILFLALPQKILFVKSLAIFFGHHTFNLQFPLLNLIKN